MMRLSQVCKQLDGTMTGADVSVQNISINTREDCQGRLFIALKGDNFDAHDFTEQAKDAGAAALMVEHPCTTDLPTIQVTDTHRALKDLAAWWRSQFSIPLIGITGSVGKTTVKEMLACMFAEQGSGVVTKGNLNNEIGVPLTLMRLTTDDQYAIVEMGMNHAGEIARLTRIARPTIAIVNNAAAAHLEGLGTVEAVAHAKGEIFEGLSGDGTAIINNDDEFAELWRGLCKNIKVISFGLGKGADVTGRFEQIGDELKLNVTALDQRFDVTLASVGEHSARNALAAIAVATAAGISVEAIKNGLSKFIPPAGRMVISRINGVTLIDDTYNANPASVRAAIRVLSTHPDGVLILGDMAELGESAEQEHSMIGEFAKRVGISRVYVCGQYASAVVESAGKNAVAFDTQDALIEFLQDNPPRTATLVKGSRSAKMERVFDAIRITLERGSADDRTGAATC